MADGDSDEEEEQLFLNHYDCYRCGMSGPACGRTRATTTIQNAVRAIVRRPRARASKVIKCRSGIIRETLQ